jgi:hypothetical protein
VSSGRGKSIEWKREKRREEARLQILGNLHHMETWKNVAIGCNA